MATNFPELGTGGVVMGPAATNFPELGTGGVVIGPATANPVDDNTTQARREERNFIRNPFFVEKLCTKMVPQKLQGFYNKSNRRVKQPLFSPDYRQE
jgi:hypothetical protein